MERVVPRLGDVIEIPTPKGFAYAQYTHKHVEPPKYGCLIRVFPQLYSERPDSFNEILLENPSIITFFPLGAACKKGIVKIVSNELISAASRGFPIFRTGVANSNGQVENWWLWDGVKEWPIGKLNDGMEKYPIRGVWNDTLLIESIVASWCYEKAT